MKAGNAARLARTTTTTYCSISAAAPCPGLDYDIMGTKVTIAST